ncbi:cyclase family protein [Dyadobacter tibetensis]|uniref:cyclase family protein n=1 Tax=Dyadobacter tibetensis TaxID=1211851 RepID=UPI000472869C|nr:cyclase family protein [Dyadobacter tibetensis]
MRAVDLTLPYSEKLRGFAQKPAKTLLQDGWNATTLTIYSHAGTHMDAPKHFGVGTQSIDQFDVSRFIVEKAWVVDLSHVAEKALLEVQDLGTIPEKLVPGDAILLRTDWYLRLGTEAYRDMLPRISEELAHWIVDRGVSIIGVETPSVADVHNLKEVTRIHQILLETVIIIEGLAFLDAIDQPYVKLLAFPLKIENGDGAPCRVIALQ